MADIWTIGSDMLVTVTGLYDTSAASYLNSATVTAQFFTSDGDDATGSAVTLSYVAASNGNYTGALSDTLTGSLVAGTWYYLKISASQSTVQWVYRVHRPADYASNWS